MSDTNPDAQYEPHEPTSPVELAAALRAVGEAAGSSTWRRSFFALADRVAEGVPLNEAVESTHARLPRGVAEMLLAGGRAGRVGAVLAALVDHYRRRAARREQLVSVLAYPGLLLLLTAVVGIVVTFYVRPEMTATFLAGTYSLVDEFGLRTPAWMSSRTQLIDSAWLHDRQPWPIVMALAGFICVCGFVLASWRAAPALFTRLVGWIPLAGALLREAIQEEWCRLTAVMVEMGRPIDEATAATAAILPPGEVANAMRSVSERLGGGESLTASLAAETTLPSTVTTVVAWGESHGAVADALRSSSELLADQVQARTEMIKNVAGPVVVVFVAGLAISFVATVLESLTIMIAILQALM